MAEYNLENEVGLLGSVMRDESIFAGLVEILEPTDFYWQSYSSAWSSMKSLHDRGMSIDVITVGDELKRDSKLDDFQYQNEGTIFSGRNALSKIREIGDPRSAWTYAAKVKDYSAKRNLELLLTTGIDWARNGRTANQIMMDMTKRMGEIKTFDSNAFEHTQSLAEAVSSAYDYTDRAARGEIDFVPTGFMDLDKLLAGGMTSPDLLVVAGRPGTGKTAFLVSVARNAALKGKKVTIFSLEMENKQIAMRLIAQEGGVSYDKQKSGQLSDMDWPKYTNAVETVASYPITLNDLPAISISKIRQELRRIKDVDLVMIDYIQLGGVDGKYDRRDQEIGELTRGLKSIAKEFQVPILAAAQLSREVEKRQEKKPILSDLRESGSIENDADIVMFIYRPDQYEKDSAKQNVAEIIVGKHRNGQVGSIELIYRSSLTRFENAASRVVRVE